MPQPTLSAGRWSCPFDIPIPRWAARGIVSSDDLDSTGTRGRLPSARKLIGVYPDEVAGQAELGGYQLMVAADIFRGRYRESPETVKAIPRARRSRTASPSRPPTMSSCRGTG